MNLIFVDLLTEKMDARSLYCFTHNIIFDGEDLFAQHKTICEGLLQQPRMCKQHALDGSMCTKFFGSLNELQAHSLSEHNVHICQICDAQSIEPLALHSHAKNAKSIHESKLLWNLIQLISVNSVNKMFGIVF